MKLVESEYRKATPNGIFTETGIAVILKMSEETLKHLRENGSGPVPCEVFANTAWYRKKDVEKFRQNPGNAYPLRPGP